MRELPLSEAAVEELLKQCRHLDIFPMELGRYQAYKGTRHPVYSIFSELLEESVEYLRIMSEEEVWELIQSIPPQLTHRLSKPTGPLSDTALEGIAESYVTYLAFRRYWPIREVLEANLDNSVVLRIYPELREKLDDDGLLKLDDSFVLSDSGIEYKDHVLHYHQFLRRGFTSRPNFDFLREFISYYYETKDMNEFRVGIDHRRIMSKEFFRQIVEFDTWHGPRFDRSKLDDPNATGLTVVKLRISGPIKRLFFSGLDRTEFFWSFRDGIKTFEVEEVSDSENVHDAYYLNRYVHSERDVARQVLRHFDGAVKAYLKDAYGDRLATNMPNQPRCHWKPKVFRIDAKKDSAGNYIGAIDVDRWIELTSLFFKGNVMVVDYFDPELYEAQFAEYEGDED